MADEDRYAEFLRRKAWTTEPSGFEPGELPAKLFNWQADLVRWACRRGRAALFEDCGLGKAFQLLAWSEQVVSHTGLPVIVITPLGVVAQTIQEGEKFGIAARACRESADFGPGINVINYDMLHKVDPAMFGGVVLDESSVIKSFSGATRNRLIEMFGPTPYKLCCTATPSPNDYTELGNHAEFLGVMTRTEMLASFFVHDGGSTQDWRVKGHAEDAFWRWVCSWAALVGHPRELGCDDPRYTLPPLEYVETIVPATIEHARSQGRLFVEAASGLSEQRSARRATMADRVRVCADIVNAEPDQQWLVFGELNSECDMLTDMIGDAIQVAGSDSSQDKEDRLLGFGAGRIRVLVTKCSIAGFGLNFQSCARMAFVGSTNSFEERYQAIRRIWRFGQERPVRIHLIASELEGAVRANLERKQRDAERMAAEMSKHTAGIVREAVRGLTREHDAYEPKIEMRIPRWLLENVA